MSDLPDHLINNWNTAKLLGIQQKEAEWLRFISIVDIMHPKNILEIGSYDGGSTISLSLLCERLLTIECIPPRYDVNLIRKNCNFTYLQGDSSSSDIVNFVKISNNELYDVVFVDGSHLYNIVKQDYFNYKNYIRPGGIMAFHDIIESDEHKKQNTLVYKLWNEIKNNYHHVEIIESPYNWGGIGIIWMP